MKNQKTLSPYIVTWVEIRAQQGVVVKHDICKIMGDIHYKHLKGSKVIFKHFANKEKAVSWLKTFNQPLEKHYDCRLCTDAQFARSDVNFNPHDIVVPFTTKQKEEVYTI